MNGSGAARTTRAWKAELFSDMEPKTLFEVMDTGDSYGKRRFIVVTRHRNSLEVIELTPDNLTNIITDQIVERSQISFEEFIAETFHIIEPPALEKED